jgi:undecaprenyl-diphosphatase
MVLSAVVFVALAVVVWHVHNAVGLDGTYRLEPGSPFRQHQAYLGSPQFVFTVAGLLALVSLAWRDWFAAALCVVGPALAGLCEIGAKHVVDRTLASSLSYPSGHAALAAGLATAVAILAFRAFSWWRAATLSAVVAVVPVGVSIALVRLTWHYPTDVVGGAALGVGIVCATALLLDRTSRKIRTN